MNKAEMIGGILGIFVTMPIWFLYWGYVPISVIVQVLIKFGTESS